MANDPDVVALNRAHGWVLLENDEVLPITNWLDENGDECDPRDAIACVAGIEGGRWYSIDLSFFEPARTS